MCAYFLPNGARIDIERIADAVLAVDDDPDVYFDTKTANLIEVATRDNLRRWIEEIGPTDRYYLIERFSDKERDELAHEFVRDIMGSMAPEYVAGAKNALRQGGWREMEDFLIKETDGWIHGWNEVLGQEAWECVSEWLTDSTIGARAVFEGCGECEICKLMAKGEEGDNQKLLEAFDTEAAMQNVARQMHRRSSGATSKSDEKRNMEKMTSAKQPDSVQSDTTESDKEILLFKITLGKGKQCIWRRIAVPTNYSFFDLHVAIQNAMGWTDSHLHEFLFDTHSQSKSTRRSKEKQITIGFPTPEKNDWLMPDKQEKLDERVEMVSDWFPERVKQCVYTYDFGDCWDHTVQFEERLPAVPGAQYPQCLTGKNACPPEDCGGLGGYSVLLRILKNPKHSEYKNMVEWLDIDDPAQFDPTFFEAKAVVFDDPRKRLQELENQFGVDPL